MKIMIKTYCFIIFLITSLFSYGQKIFFQKNINSTAQNILEVQKLNISGDSLILESNQLKIIEVDILNDDYLQTIRVDSLEAKIGLNHLPYGNYVIQTKVKNHNIVMYLEKIKDLDSDISYVDIQLKEKMRHISKLPIEVDGKYFSFYRNTLENQIEEKKMYWVVSETNSSFSSTKTMGLKYPEEIIDLIVKVKLEERTEVGKNNKLLIFEVYDTAEFMSRQLRNRKYYEKGNSTFFNVIPFYSSEDVMANTSNNNLTYNKF